MVFWTRQFTTQLDVHILGIQRDPRVDQALKNRRPGKGRVGERVECLARAAA